MSQGPAVAQSVTNSLEVPFPEAPRVLYAKNPLAQVICQLRFPPVLRIDSEAPSNFQDRIRDSFPLLNEEEEVLPIEVPPELLQLLKTNRSPQMTRRSWKFMSEDVKWTISLTREFASLSTEVYKCWEDFREKIVLMSGALQDAYHPSFITRTGLRYRDLIIRSELGLSNVPWSELLQPHIAAEYSKEPFAEAIQEAAHFVQVEFPGQKCKLGLRHGTAQREGKDETGYLIDCDFYTDERTEVPNVLDRLNSFNRTAGRLFRWCITERLHKAMEPGPI